MPHYQKLCDILFQFDDIIVNNSVILQIFMVSEMLTTSYLNLVSTQTATMLNGAH